MDKLIKALLGAKYPTANIDSLFEIVQQTPNAVVATEILCGVYEEPILSEAPSDQLIANNTPRFEIILIGYDK